MTHYLAMIPKYLAAHKKNTRLTIVSVMIAVALVTTIFSMLDVFWKFEKQQVINDVGSYHIIINDITDEDADAISNRIDVEASSRYITFQGAKMNGNTVAIATADEGIEKMFRSDFVIMEGTLPQNYDEVVVEDWARDRFRLNINDRIPISFDGSTKIFKVSGICKDFSGTKAEAIPGLLVSVDGAYSLNPSAVSSLIVQFKEHVKINRAEQDLMQTFRITQEQIGHNERLLALTGQSVNSTVLGLYGTGVILFVLVLVAGVTMIYNTFHISVMQRVQQFGLLRCIGASKKQIKKLVYKEARYIALRSIPVGILVGILAAFVCSAILKFYNSSFFAEIPLFSVSLPGIIAGIAVGILTVFLASLVPARKAARVSPVNAVTGSEEVRVSTKEKRGILTGVFPAEIALGIGNSVSKKKTLVLMSASIAISIILFLGFQVFVSFMYASMKVNKPYTADISLTSESSLSYNLYTELSEMDGINRIYGRMFGYVEAAFDASRLTDAYQQVVGDVKISADGLFEAPEQSWLISYDKNQLKWAKIDLLGGTLSEEKLNEKNGIIAVVQNIRQGVSMETASLKLGDQIRIQTIQGPRDYTVMGILRSVPFSDNRLNLATFITTEKLYTEITGDTTLDVIDIQLKKANQEQTVSELKSKIEDHVNFFDSRQKNEEATQAFLTMAVFMYGFVIVIAFISILNIINTMHTSVSAKTRYLGVMRAIGMSGKQLNKMIVTEAGTYALAGSIAGIILGVLLQRFLVTTLLSGVHMKWEFPLEQVMIIFVIALVVTLLSVMAPLKKLKSKGISENIGSLQ